MIADPAAAERGSQMAMPAARKSRLRSTGLRMATSSADALHRRAEDAEADHGGNVRDLSDQRPAIDGNRLPPG